ncbi:MFS transporter [Streptomyces sp. ICBB 8177]|uniref:MFS transporter n=1 Tax=Streptomyces sp. ICBB 8177 TaxID=563922 RepID=UPI000D6778ED|nr:MFS transporter [Streptomyces sp. ICBB 8177]PWI42454.1 MFS transporter [Streptomyces sp. ICBB 8177]
MTGGRRRSLGRRFGWLWAAYAVSSYGSGLGFGAFPLIAVLVLHSGPAQVAALSAAGRAVGALLAVPLGPWVEFRRKRPVMIATDLARFAAMASVPAAYALGCLGFVQLLVVSVVVAAANIAFKAASGAYLKALVPPEDLLIANGRFESTTWTSTVVGPPLGGAAIALFGPATTVIADAVSYLLSAVGIRAIGGSEERPSVPRRAARTRRPRLGELLEGWRYVLASAALRPLFFNAMLSNGLIMATEPLLAVLLLGRLGFAPWQYGLAFAAPCVGGLIGSRMAHRLVNRFGQHRVMLWSGAGRAVWLVGLAFVRPGAAGMAVVIVCQLGLVTCCGVFNPVLATYRLAHTAPDRVARTLSAWSVSTSAAIAATTALWGVLASATSPRTALALAGTLFLATPLLLPRRERAPGVSEVAVTAR